MPVPNGTSIDLSYACLGLRWRERGVAARMLMMPGLFQKGGLLQNIVHTDSNKTINDKFPETNWIKTLIKSYTDLTIYEH